MGAPGNFSAYMHREEGEWGSDDGQEAGPTNSWGVKRFHQEKVGTESAKFTYMIPARVVVMMVGGNASDDFDTQLLGR